MPGIEYGSTVAGIFQTVPLRRICQVNGNLDKCLCSESAYGSLLHKELSLVASTILNNMNAKGSFGCDWVKT